MSQLDKLIHVGEDYLRFISSLSSQPTTARPYETAFIDCVKDFDDKALPAESKFLYGYICLQKGTSCEIDVARSVELLEQARKEGYVPAALVLAEFYQRGQYSELFPQEPDYHYQLLALPITKGHPHALYLKAKFLGDDWWLAPKESRQKDSLAMQAQIAKKFLEDMGYCGSHHLSYLWSWGGGPGESSSSAHEDILRQVINSTEPTDIFTKEIIIDSQFLLGDILYGELFKKRDVVEGLRLIRAAAATGHSAAQAWLKARQLTLDEESGADQSSGPMSYFKKSLPGKSQETVEPVSAVPEEKTEEGKDSDESGSEDPRDGFEYVYDSKTKKTFRIHKPDHSLFGENEPSTVEDFLRPLDSLIGVDDVKAEVRQLLDYCHATRIRSEAGLNSRPVNLHCVFTGAPGTGKTTVARLLGTILHKIGILRTGQVVEVDSSDLVGRYIGDTTAFTKAALEAAAGGILFIDEAYAASEVDYYGDEFVNTMVKHMEDHAADLMVIAAGYTTQMSQFMQANPGFRSRFAKTLHFPDLSVAQLVPVFMTLCEMYDYTVSPFAMKRLESAIVAMKKNEGPRFGNARSVRNMFDEIIKRQAGRVVREALKDRDDLMAITAGDISSSDDEGGDDVITLANRKRKS